MKSAIAIVFGLNVAFGVQLLAQENSAQDNPRQHPDPFRRFFTSPGFEFSKQQQARVEEIKREFLPKLTENQNKWNGVITAEQLQARREAFQKARDAGKEGQELRGAVNAAVKFTADQQKQRAAIQSERNKILAEIRSDLVALLTDDQQTKFRQSQLAQEQIPPTHANVKYGNHERNVFDLWLAESDKPTPLVIYIHGGGFRGGSW